MARRTRDVGVRRAGSGPLKPGPDRPSPSELIFPPHGIVPARVTVSRKALTRMLVLLVLSTAGGALGWGFAVWAWLT